MDDLKIITLLFKRDEEGLSLMEKRYFRMLKALATRITDSEQDSEEIANDTLLRAWSTIPPSKPGNLGAYLSKIARNLAIDRYNSKNAKKRGGQIASSLYELELCLPDKSAEIRVDSIILRDALNEFLSSLDKEKRIIFMQRYFHALSVKEIARENRISEAKVKTVLLRMRTSLKEHLTRKGVVL